MPTPDRPEQMAEHDTITNKDEKALERDLHGDMQLPATLQQHSSAFSEMLAEF